MFKVIIFAVVSLGFVLVSWASFRDVRSHGFFRFFAWECILALILLNIAGWFLSPFSLHQIVSWILLIVSGFLVIHGAYLLRAIGKPESKRKDAYLIGIEKTTVLVTNGAYKYIRHPLYSSLLFLGWGVFFKDPSLVGGILVVIATAFLVVAAKVEEAENIRFFGSAYRTYMKETKMFIPFLF